MAPGRVQVYGSLRIWGGGPAGTAKCSLERLQEASFQELSELGGRLELWDGIQFLECRSERIGKAPDGSWLEFLVLRLEVQFMDGTGEVLRSFESAFHEGFVDNNLTMPNHMIRSA